MSVLNDNGPILVTADSAVTAPTQWQLMLCWNLLFHIASASLPAQFFQLMATIFLFSGFSVSCIFSSWFSSSDIFSANLAEIQRLLLEVYLLLNAANAVATDTDVCSKNHSYLEEMHQILDIQLKEKFDAVHVNIHSLKSVMLSNTEHTPSNNREQENDIFKYGTTFTTITWLHLHEHGYETSFWNNHKQH